MTYTTFFYNAHWWVQCDGRLLGGYSANTLRSYVFPLYTPQGALVLQECPPDHPHHQGIFVGLEVDGHDLWAAGSEGRARHRQEIVPALGELRPVVTTDGVLFTHATRWVSVDGVELLHEQRQVHFRQTARATEVSWRSQFAPPTPTASAHLGQTKESGIGLRVPPHWETIFGGRIRNAVGDEGEAACFDRMSPWLNIEGPSGQGGVAGVIFAPQNDPCPWFTRDYGLHVYNPARQRAFVLAPGEALVWAARVLAYDGSRPCAQIEDLVRI